MNLKEYSPDWKDVIRPLILQRDNYRCRVCGVVHKSRVYKLSRAGYHVCDEFEEIWAAANNKKVFSLFLVVAHIDQDKSNNDPSNLITLCPFHHAKFDAKHKALSRKIKFSKPKEMQQPNIPAEMENYTNVLKEITGAVRELTGCSISRSEAENIYQITLKFLQNEQI